MSTNKTGAIENKMHQNDHNGVIIREDRKKISNERKRERDSEGTKRRNEGKVRKWREEVSLTSVSKATSRQSYG